MTVARSLNIANSTQEVPQHRHTHLKQVVVHGTHNVPCDAHTLDMLDPCVDKVLVVPVRPCDHQVPILSDLLHHLPACAKGQVLCAAVLQHAGLHAHRLMFRLRGLTATCKRRHSRSYRCHKRLLDTGKKCFDSIECATYS